MSEINYTSISLIPIFWLYLELFIVHHKMIYFINLILICTFNLIIITIIVVRNIIFFLGLNYYWATCWYMVYLYSRNTHLNHSYLLFFIYVVKLIIIIRCYYLIGVILTSHEMNTEFFFCVLNSNQIYKLCTMLSMV